MSQTSSPAVDLEAAKRAAESVADPCGIMYGNDMTFGDLGMVEAVDADGGTVTVRIILDDPNCLYMGQIIEGMEAAVLEIPGVEHVVVRNRRDAIWSREFMPLEGKKKMQAHRRRKEQRLEELRVQLRRDASSEAARDSSRV